MIWKNTVVVIAAAAVVSTLVAAPPSLTIYSAQRENNYSSEGHGFGVVRETIPLTLQAGENDMLCPRVSPFLDPASVMLHDPTGRADFRILQQKFNDNVLTEHAMLERYEGQAIPFQVSEGGKNREVMGKIIRAGYWDRSRNSVDQTSDPIIEIDGRIVFKLPGTAIFPKLSDTEILKPELRWKIGTSKAIKTDAELVYMTDGLGWQTDYNAIMAEDGKISQFVGWITLENETGLRFEKSQVNLIAGNVKRIRGGLARSNASAAAERVIVTGSNIPTAEQARYHGPSVQRLTFDEYHEYTLPAAVTLSDRELTQVELVRATNVNATRSFVYDGSNISVTSMDYAQLESSFGTDSNSKVGIISEFKNDSNNQLGVPLPQGIVHFYKSDAEGRLQFSGDSSIENTPKDEMVRAVTGYAFDLVGERRQTEYRVNEDDRTADESFEIKIRNHRKDATNVRVWEHPNRWRQWEITAKSQPYKKVDQNSFEFVVSVPPDQETKLTYTIRYSQLPRARGE